MDKITAIEVMNTTELFGEAYDRDPKFGEAMNLLVPGFEYPDFAGKACCDILLYVLRKNNKKIKTIKTGSVFLTSGVNCDSEVSDVLRLIKRHSSCDFGELGEEDKLRNYIAIACGEGRILSKYSLSGKPVYVITDFEVIDEEEGIDEPRRTTVMFCDEY